RGQNVVILHEQFPSNAYAWRELTRTRDAELRIARRAPADDWTAAVLEAIDRNTAVVALPYCHWTDGTRVDLVTVGARAREVGAASGPSSGHRSGAGPAGRSGIPGRRARGRRTSRRCPITQRSTVPVRGASTWVNTRSSCSRRSRSPA